MTIVTRPTTRITQREKNPFDLPVREVYEVPVVDHLPLVDEDEAALGALDVHRLLLVRQRHVLLQPELGLQLLAALVALELLLLQQTLLLSLVGLLVAEMGDKSYCIRRNNPRIFGINGGSILGMSLLQPASPTTYRVI